MILNYKFKNFMSFKEDVEFSMLAPKTKVKNRFPDNFVSSNTECDILKTAVIVGENAGGKSNFVRSIEYLKTFFKDNEVVRSYKGCININNVMDKCPKNYNSLQKFEIEILIEDKGIYLYYLEVDIFGIVKEVLSFKEKYKQKYKTILFVERKEKDMICKNEQENCEENKCKIGMKVGYVLDIPEFNSQMEELFGETIQKQANIGLFVSKIAMLGSEHAIKFTQWIKDNLCPETNVINYGIYRSFKNEEDDFRILNDKKYLEIFKMVDYSIIGIKIDEEKPYSKTQIIRKKEDGSIFVRELSRDSNGVIEFFAWATQIFRVVYENKVVFADEMDRVLNPVLSDRVISFINGKEHKGQFIFTTHNVLHLDLKNYMKEQIYFVTKDAEKLESEMYSLADFPEIRYETTKIYEFYMKGILGGTAIE